MTNTITDALEALRAGEVSSADLVRRAIAVADRHDDGVGMFLDRYDESALAAAAEADAAHRAGAEVGPLHGVPLGVKDIITTREGPTTAQSLVHDPASTTGDAVVVERLRRAGAIVLGKLTTMEFAIGGPDPTKPFPIPRNPWSPDHWAGGSSSGSGSAVSLGAVLGALGTDTGGSIRIPSSFCGITGLMPTFGRVPKSGCVPLGFSLDHIGPMARSARDCALLLEVIAGPDPSDPSSLDLPVPRYSAGLTGDLTGVRIGVDRLDRVGAEREDAALGPALDAALAALRARGAQVVPVELPHYLEMSIADWVIMLGEAMAYHRPDLQRRWHEYGASTRRTLLRGLLYSAADYVQAQRVRRVGQRALAGLFERVDLVVTPTAAGGAFPLTDLGDEATVPSDVYTYLYTGYWDTTGHPVLTVPAGFGADGLPLGMQICGRPFDEGLVLRAGDAFQAATDWHLRTPSLIDTHAEEAR